MTEFFQTMSLIKQMLVQIKSDRRGVTAMEYGLIAALISAVLVVAVGKLTGGLTTVFTRIGGALT